MNNHSKRIDGGLLRGLIVWGKIFKSMKLEKQMSAYNFSKDEVGSVPETEKSG